MNSFDAGARQALLEILDLLKSIDQKVEHIIELDRAMECISPKKNDRRRHHEKVFRRLNHKLYGLTELVAIDKDGKGIKATGFFEDEDAFFLACRALSDSNNLYVGRNPRPFSISSSIDRMDPSLRIRASDSQIEILTAFSLDIDPLRKKGSAATVQQREAALKFALLLQRFIGGHIDSSGNGAYLWISFRTPIKITPENSTEIKTQCKTWQERIRESFVPEDYGLRIDGCFDFSRLKRAIGTYNYKAGRLSSIHLEGDPSDKIRDEILSIPTHRAGKKDMITSIQLHDSPPKLPSRFLQLLDEDRQLRELWETPFSDTSSHDWALGKRCIELEISEPSELAIILTQNPFGKYQRDGRKQYVERSVEKLLLDC